ncbi:NlpC/P60 family peptidoglycan endopeptidase RipB [Candidatus Mycolicibacterium alkanivorans]|uniref:NlpC/P60 family peptidoglycan endopeptidase RipB n=1 Tax=Candidatus Mycolicibacterium alkanivorans TaxID=2954114 RepID=A0ABS9YXT7_9MYCO|nr:NlpC/P60 family peptidoglycan endopeptidase RipB [Candidatus Mycolicibacterium alkanivorans]MCI4676071.1 NlpC/P60 family peptidoglycan endopeptidase RipB [Candidatus Mycolicibacterium alkanivorans]
MSRNASRRLRAVGTVLTALVLALGFASPASADPGEWDPTLPKVLSAGAPGDPVAIANASLQATTQAAQATVDMGRKFLAGLGIGGSGSRMALPGGRVSGPQAIEYVIARGASQRGVPYSWGGGAVNGPSAGVDEDAGKLGYDCSGFTRYAFAGVGVLLPKYSGDQYNAGRHVPPSQAKRGDLIFYGPGGTQHVTIYLGNGQMLEASSAAGQVTVSPVRTAGMTPYLTRVIET